VTTEDPWQEASIDLPDDLPGRTDVTVEAREREPGTGRFSSFHYWVYAAP
jgi:hypothetical protein